MHQRVATDMSCTSCLWEVSTVLYLTTAIKFCSNVMNHDSDSVKVRRLSHGSPQPSGVPSIIRCLLFFIFLKNLHDFPSENVISAAPILTMSDNMLPLRPCCELVMLKFHRSGTPLEACGSGRVLRREWWKV